MKKRTLAIIIALVLVIGCAAAGTIAWLTSTSKQVKNTFTVGKVEIVLDEEPVVYNSETGKWVTDEEAETPRVYENEYKLVMPGDTLAKDPTVTVLDGSADCYVRVKLTLALTEKGVAAAEAAAADKDEVAKVKAIIAGMLEDLDATLVGFDETTWIPYGAGTYEALTIDNATAKSMVESLMGEKHSVSIELWYKEVVPAVTAGTYSNENPDGEYTGEKLAPVFTAIVVPGDLDEVTMPIFDGMTITLEGNAIQAKNLDTAVAAWQAFDGVEAPAEGGTVEP